MCESAVGRGPRIVSDRNEIVDLEQYARKAVPPAPSEGLFVPIPVFRSVFISTALGFQPMVVSPAIRASGNRAVVAALAMNSAGAFNASLQGSYDGKTWVELGNASIGPPMGYLTVGVGDARAPLSYAWIRVRLTAAKARAHATVVFSAI